MKTPCFETDKNIIHNRTGEQPGYKGINKDFINCTSPLNPLRGIQGTGALIEIFEF